MKRLGPGIYDDGRGAVHVDVAELLEHLGVPSTHENEELAIRAAARAAEIVGDIPVDVVQDDVAYALRRRAGE